MQKKQLSCSCNKTYKEMTGAQSDACRSSVGPAVEPSTQVLPPQSSLKHSSGRWRSLANYEYLSIWRYGV